MNLIEDYINQDIFNPKYLFHGSPYKMDDLIPNKSTDINNKDNEDDAIFLTSWFLNATAYAFRNKLKEVNEKYDFKINNDGEYPVMTFNVDNIPEGLYGYVYVFEKNKDMIKDNKEKTTQYRCYKDLKAQTVIKVHYKDFENYFDKVEENNKSK